MDEKETITVRKSEPKNRNEFISEPYEIEAFTKFTFPGGLENFPSSFGITSVSQEWL